MLVQISVYITAEQWERLQKEDNKSEAVRQALELYWKEKAGE